MIFAGKITIEAEGKGIRKKLAMLITKREHKNPLLGMPCLQKFKWTMRNIENSTTTTEQSEKERINTKFEMSQDKPNN